MKLRHQCDKIDIDNDIKFRYYIICGKYLKINNQYPCSIYCDKIGTEIELIFDNIIPNNDIVIKLYYDGANYKYVRIKHDDIPLVRMTLVATSFDKNYGTTWYIKNYTGNIILE